MMVENEGSMRGDSIGVGRWDGRGKFEDIIEERIIHCASPYAATFYFSRNIFRCLVTDRPFS